MHAAINGGDRVTHHPPSPYAATAGRVGEWPKFSPCGRSTGKRWGEGRGEAQVYNTKTLSSLTLEQLLWELKLWRCLQVLLWPAAMGRRLFLLKETKHKVLYLIQSSSFLQTRQRAGRPEQDFAPPSLSLSDNSNSKVEIWTFKIVYTILIMSTQSTVPWMLLLCIHLCIHISLKCRHMETDLRGEQCGIIEPGAD